MRKENNHERMGYGAEALATSHRHLTRARVERPPGMQALLRTCQPAQVHSSQDEKSFVKKQKICYFTLDETSSLFKL